MVPELNLLALQGVFTPFTEIIIYIYPLKSFWQIALNMFCRYEGTVIRI